MILFKRLVLISTAIHNVSYLISNVINENRDLINQNTGTETFFKWITGVLYYHLNQNFLKSIDMLTNIEWDTTNRGLSIEILSSIGIIHYEERNYDQAQIYFDKAISMINETVAHNIKIKLFFNASLCLKKSQKIEQAIQLIIKAIDDSIESHSLFSLGDLYYAKSTLYGIFWWYTPCHWRLKHSDCPFQVTKTW